MLCSPANIDHKPKVVSNRTEGGQHIGSPLQYCINGLTGFGVRELQWTWSRDDDLETVNITSELFDPPCLSCDCFTSYRDHHVVQELLQNKTVGGARGVAFSVLGYISSSSDETILESWRCSGVATHFLSFVIVSELTEEDHRSQLSYMIHSLTGEDTDGDYAVQSGDHAVVHKGTSISYFKYNTMKLWLSKYLLKLFFVKDLLVDVLTSTVRPGQRVQRLLVYWTGYILFNIISRQYRE